jgi:hypothetical protein
MISSKLHVRHFQATDRVRMRLAYLAHVCGRLKCVLTKNEELVCKAKNLTYSDELRSMLLRNDKLQMRSSVGLRHAKTAQSRGWTSTRPIFATSSSPLRGTFFSLHSLEHSYSVAATSNSTASPGCSQVGDEAYLKEIGNAVSGKIPLALQ